MGFIADRAGIRTALTIRFLAVLLSSFFHPNTTSLMAAAALYGLVYFSMFRLFPASASPSIPPRRQPSLTSQMPFSASQALWGIRW
ncbi:MULTISPECIES: hypothetical protein [unclassified Mesorhizobium]|uniref:hypothetical protein n=1 Tax=unclassified Mesorhizobium TaxID=325217 RepID=UPI000FCAB536|nr:MULTISPECIES: hypothetical protein [unclassified Mesorhizobium]RUV53914.1 hypothetical protein EOA85_26905 [Mesorhizobium sp. M5C.F.Ca.IN.020.29.1.1]RWA95899.1 MAG: hypothetical protein EOQ33_34290 [Mesorhizobium sp.]RWC07607.1 MAG: hypothetical protein EOS51_27240 [Mesorhizobium sp.]RWD74436.1 MAG: hypothetical protein EOS48_32570 [Mesorhizobium sp.]RWE51808.1 MAG: hypothetical protein EOS67_31780 [Mesorhizobium sp.]